MNWFGEKLKSLEGDPEFKSEEALLEFEEYLWDIHMKVEYPTRCRVIDAEGYEVGPGVFARSPKGSLPYVGQEGLAERVGAKVVIKLDGGGILEGSDCWWVPID